ncbi:MAG: phosphohydrolase [Chitinophagaceae bacterium]|nr:phosphohydrolase [Chitinophagaceae bacterium]
MTESGFQQLKEVILLKLHDGLDPRLIYHSLGHTKDVLQQAERIAKSENISDARVLLLIKIASLFHDAGFLYTYQGHEEKSCEIMLQSLDSKLFEKNELTMIQGMIMATKIPQSPSTLPEKIICDADLDYLGRDDFEVISNCLKQEFLTYNIIGSEHEWDQLQVRFIENHLYFTDTSIKERYPGKLIHLEKLKQKLVDQSP